jgi:hypothetical protein
MQASLVCRKWQAEADASCQEVSLLRTQKHVISDTQLAALQQWLPQRGTAVKRLTLRLQPHRGSHQLKLPAGLCSLQIQGANSRAPVLSDALAASLTCLVLQLDVSYDINDYSYSESDDDDCWMATCIYAEQLLQQLRGLKGLRHLGLVSKDGAAIQHLRALQAVSHLRHLTFLELRCRTNYTFLGADTAAAAAAEAEAMPGEADQVEAAQP